MHRLERVWAVAVLYEQNLEQSNALPDFEVPFLYESEPLSVWLSSASSEIPQPDDATALRRLDLKGVEHVPF